MVGPQWEQKIVAELDSAINKWIDMVPLHCECSANMFHCRPHNSLNRSTMGPRSRRSSLPEPVGYTLCELLFAADLHTQAIYSVTSQTFTAHPAFLGDLHKRGAFLHACP